MRGLSFWARATPIDDQDLGAICSRSTRVDGCVASAPIIPIERGEVTLAVIRKVVVDFGGVLAVMDTIFRVADLLGWWWTSCRPTFIRIAATRSYDSKAWVEVWRAALTWRAIARVTVIILKALKNAIRRWCQRTPFVDTPFLTLSRFIIMLHNTFDKMASILLAKTSKIPKKIGLNTCGREKDGKDE